MIADVLTLLRELCLLLGAVVLAVFAAGGEERTAFHGSYTVGATLHAVRVIGPLASVLMLSRGIVRGHHRETEYAVLLALASLGSVLLAGTSDLLVLIAAYLLASVPLYALAGFAKDPAGTESGLKLVLFGALLGIGGGFVFAFL